MRAKDPGAREGFLLSAEWLILQRDIANVAELLSSPASRSELDFIIAEAEAGQALP